MNDKNEENKKGKNRLFKAEEIDFNDTFYKNPYLKDDMDEQTKERFEIINNFEIKYMQNYLRLRKTENSELIKQKIIDFKNTVGIKISEKCHNEFNELKKHIKIDKIGYSITTLPLFTQDEDYNLAHQKFLYCSSHERRLIDRLDEKVKFLSFVYDFQYSLCKKNCVETKFYGVREDYENCILQCLKYTHKNVDPAIEGVLEELVDDYSYMLEHMTSGKKI